MPRPPTIPLFKPLLKPLLLKTLLPASLLALLVLSACSAPGVTAPTGDDAPPTTTPPATPTAHAWSDPGSWPAGRVPAEGDEVRVPAGVSMLLDTSPPPLGGLTIEGTLVFDQRDLTLSADWILVEGKLEIGTSDTPFRHRALITLTGSATDEVAGLGGKVLGASGSGVIQMIGEPRLAWTRLAATARPGDTRITLAEAPDWRAGERIVIASTDFDADQAETLTIAGVFGTSVSLDSPLANLHWGETETVDDHTLDGRAEVALLSRTITVQGDAASEVDGFGAHTIATANATLHLDGVEVYRAGQRGRMGRYPVHFHRMGDAARGSFVRRVSVHHSFNRCYTVHGSNGVLLEDNVGYDAPGHCFFLEDGAEVDNRFVGNLGLGVRRPDEADALLESDLSFLGPAVYWITNPQNSFVGNVAAGSEGSGFWIALPEHPTGPSADADVWPRRTPLVAFEDNLAHSNGADGLHVDRGPSADGSATETTFYAAYADPQNPESEPVEVRFERFVAHRNRGRGVWLRGRLHTLADPVLADNAIGATFASDDTVLRGGLLLGESANPGQPSAWEIANGRAGPDGRSLPRPWDPTHTLRGFEFYDGRVGVEGAHFSAFEANAQRLATALDYLNFTDFAVHPDNYAAGLTFDPATTRVHLETRAAPADPTRGSEDGYRAAAFLDLDGSVSGKAGHHVVVDNPFLLTDNCETSRRADWNAWVCDERYVALSFSTDTPELAGVTLSRDDGPSHTAFGTGSAPSTSFRTLLLPERRHGVAFDAAPPGRVRVVLHHGSGTWVELSIPSPGAPEVERYGRRLTPESSLAALAGVTESSYYHDADGGTLHLRLVADGSYEAIEVAAGTP